MREISSVPHTIWNRSQTLMSTQLFQFDIEIKYKIIRCSFLVKYCDWMMLLWLDILFNNSLISAIKF